MKPSRQDAAARRAELLRQLVELTAPPEPAMKELAKLGWDWAGAPLVIIERRHMASVLERFLAGTLSVSELRGWAERLEGRDDVGFEEEHGDLLRELFFRIANTEINGAITAEVAGAMKDVLA